MNNSDCTEYPLTIPYAMLSCKRFHLCDLIGLIVFLIQPDTQIITSKSILFRLAFYDLA